MEQLMAADDQISRMVEQAREKLALRPTECSATDVAFALHGDMAGRFERLITLLQQQQKAAKPRHILVRISPWAGWGAATAALATLFDRAFK